MPQDEIGSHWFATMPDGGARTVLFATRAGRPALEILKTVRRGRVAALFERSFYITLDKGWVCMGTDELPLGPLNVRSSAPNQVTWESSGLRIDDSVVSSDGKVRIGQTLCFDLGDILGWDPPAPPPWTMLSVKAGLDALDRLAEPPTDAGLACFVPADRAPNPGNEVIEAARQPVEILSRAAARAFKNMPFKSSELDGAVIALLGLGPGLTPSGDDFLGGMLIALNILPAPPLRARLHDLIEMNARQRTNAISVAHLHAAGAGAGQEALHEAFNSLLSGDTEALPARFRAIDRIGHSSGWDALAGLCVTLRAFVSATDI